MPQGLQVFDQFGNLKVDISERLFRFLGQIIVSPGSSGSVTNDGLLTGTPFFVANMYSNNSASFWPGEALLPPNVSFGGNQMFYTVNAGMPTQIIQFGVY